MRGTHKPPANIGKTVQKKIEEVIQNRGVITKTRSFPQFPQPQLSSQSKILLGSCDDDERGGNVENSVIPEGAKTLRGAKVCGFHMNGVENCRRQVYTSTEEAEGTVRTLGRFGVPAAVEAKCPVCGKVHLKRS